MTSIGCTTDSLYSGSIAIGCGDCMSEGPMFIASQDISFINGLNRELIKCVGAQKLTYFRVDPVRTAANIYGESKTKNFLNGVDIYARVEKQEPVQVINEFTLDQTDKISIFFDQYQLKRFNIKPTVGDFVRYGSILYEILTCVSWTPIYGIITEELLVKCECANVRNTQIDPSFSEEP